MAKPYVNRAYPKNWTTHRGGQPTAFDISSEVEIAQKLYHDVDRVLLEETLPVILTSIFRINLRHVAQDVCKRM